jgi:NAD(P)-dependent dehydrogenase (short-subunit alcohol dehydrogenase family)
VSRSCPPLGRPGGVDPGAFADTIEVDLQGAFACAQAASDHLLASEGGSVLTVDGGDV